MDKFHADNRRAAGIITMVPSGIRKLMFRRKFVALFVSVVVVLTTLEFIFPGGLLARTLGALLRVDLPLLSESTGFLPSSSQTSCHFPLPNVFEHQPLQGNSSYLKHASHSLQRYLVNRVTATDIDSLAIAVVTPAGIVFEGGYGVLRANDTGAKQHLVNRKSIYRVASISKMFTVLETLLLRERGVLDFDDPVEKFLPEFTPPDHSYGWAERLHQRGSTSRTLSKNKKKALITLRQLASHTSGLGRDYPLLDIGEWPVSTPWVTRKALLPDLPERTVEGIMESIKKYPLVNVPYSYPIYSNTGFDILGLANVAANLQAASVEDRVKEPKTHKELLKRDIFDVFGLNSSFYRVPEGKALKDHIAVPAQNAEWTDKVLGDADDSAGGQYSSLEDLATVMQIFLSPSPPKVGYEWMPDLVREWLRPLHVWQDGLQAVGAPWEIEYMGPKQAPLYSKSGNLPGYHSKFTLNPQYSYGIVALVTGTYANTAEIVSQALTRFQPAFEIALHRQVSRTYVGIWKNKDDIAVIQLIRGGLFITKLIINGIDVLSIVQHSDNGLSSLPSEPVALWSTGRLGEFRLAFGRQELNHAPFAGCMPYWVTIDPGLISRGAPLDLIYWEGDADGNSFLVYPSAGVRFTRLGQES